MANQGGLFGPSPQETQFAIGQADQANINANVTANAPLAISRAAATGGQALGKFAGALGGFQDPRMQKAMLMEEAKQEVDASGVDLMNDSQGYYNATAAALAKRGLVDEAMRVKQIAMAEEAQQAELAYKNAQTTAELNKPHAIGKGGSIRPDGSIIAPLSSEVTKPNSTQGKIETDYANGVFGEPGSPEAEAAKAAALAKANHIAQPASTRITIDTAGENEFNKAVGKNRGAAVVTENDTAMNAYQRFDHADHILDTLDNGSLIIGPGADARLAIAKAFNILGADNDETIANTQKLISDLNNNTLAAIKSSGLGTGQGFTEKDLRFLDQATSGGINAPEDTLRYIADINRRVGIAMIKKWNRTLGSFDDKQRESLRKAGLNVNPIEIPEYEPYKPKWKDKPVKPIPSKAPEGVEQKVWDVMDESDKRLWLK